MKNILELCLSPDLGGLELYFHSLTSYLQDNSNTFALINKKGKLKNIFDTNNTSYFTISTRKPLFSILNLKTIIDIVDKNKIDIIHIHWTKDLYLAVLVKIFSKNKPKIIQTRHMHMTRFKNDFFHKLLYTNIDSIIAVTEEVKNELNKFIPQKVRPKIIRSYIGTKEFSEISKDVKKKLIKQYNLKQGFTIGIIGRIEEEKGQHLVIEAINKLTKKKIHANGLIIGHTMNENYLNQLKNKIHKWDLSKNIIFTGFTTNVQELMQLCDVIVLATSNETFGLVLIEAMKSKVCVIATNKGGPREIIEHNKSGLLFEVKNSNDLTQQLLYLLNHPEKKASFINQAYQKANKAFSEKKQFEEVFNIILSI